MDLCMSDTNDELCIFDKIECTIYTAAHLPYVEIWLCSDRLPSLITSFSLPTSHTDRADFLSVWKIACLWGGDMSLE